MLRRLSVFALVLGLAVVAARAHDMWLEPSSFTPGEGQPVSIALWVGHGDERDPVPRTESHIVRFEAESLDEESRRVPGVSGTHPAGVLPGLPPGTTAIVYVSHDALSTLPAADFQEYLVEEGLDEILRLRERSGSAHQPGRERYSRSLKSLVVVGSDGEVPVDRTTGIPLELTLREVLSESDAWRVTMELSFQSRTLAGAYVDVESLEGSSSTSRQSARSNEKGMVTFDLPPGSWKIATVHMVPSGAADADWRSFWATLTFRLPDRPPRTEQP